VEESTEPRATTDIGAGWSRRFGCNEPVLDALVIPLAVVVGPELGQRPSQAGLTDEHQAVQAFLFDRAHEPLGVRIAIRRSVWRLDDAYSDVLGMIRLAGADASSQGRRVRSVCGRMGIEWVS
jgi:hypothetical protein